ncbi:30S ribosomal protein S3 [Candidatus Phycorickettsia trachydisci]|uniref:Small ribosomal subunit protein uS3 n=1 Tax=Candidatus Phycorickettsia trachydisci TaxID=2115978 RepID=A0A2P1P8Z5_9RICK|nr:30S ribosomal protein S3 [Candidatus Phycorickettsia trachydisci]AVP87727.1 30S ribosomal protein S3 [Candidatus Phycorickettsia trachydisci]
MGQKVKPICIRVGKGLPASFSSVFFAEKNYASWLLDDYKIRNKIKQEYAKAQISKVVIQRASEKSVRILLSAFKPKFLVGENGAIVEKLKNDIAKEFGFDDVKVSVNHVYKNNLEASIVAYNVAKQIENYVMFRFAMKKAVDESMKQGALGIKMCCSGRLGGAEIARTEGYKQGQVPLHTFRADIDYAECNAKTKYGIIGVKVWIHRKRSNYSKKASI